VAQKRALSADGKGGGDIKNIEEEYMGSPTGKEVNGKLGGVMCDPTLEASSRSLGVTRIIYRTSNSTSPSIFAPRETCCLQDSFVDEEGIAYVYEISVLHKKVFGCKGHTTAEVLFLAHIARPDPQDNNQSILSVISQVDNKTGGLPDWLGNIIPDSSKNSSVTFEGLARELQEAKRQHAKLMNLDEEEDMGEATLEGDACIDDFELLAVLGRGGFGKVMMVRHKTDQNVYAMKVLKKAELLRRRQVERTRTERHILEKVRAAEKMFKCAPPNVIPVNLIRSSLRCSPALCSFAGHGTPVHGLLSLRVPDAAQALHGDGLRPRGRLLHVSPQGGADEGELGPALRL
jgi:hypothetical protein